MKNSRTIVTSVESASKAVVASRAKIVSLVFIVYWLLVFEGALRKWLFPEYNKIIFFIRDPFVLLIYYYALKGRLFSKNPFALVSVFLSILIIPAVVYHLLESSVSPIVLLYGWRNYFFYVPLAFIICDCFRAADLNKWVIQNVFLSVPMALLVFFQYSSSPDSFINKGIDDGFVFQVVEGVVRTTGTFTFTASYGLYAASIFALFLAVVLRRDLLKMISTRALALVALSCMALVLLSGSRTVFFLVTLILISAIFAGALARKRQNKLRFLVAPVALIVFTSLTFVFGFTDSLNSLLERQADAVSEEGSTISRAFSSLYMFTEVIGQTPLLGYGIGFGTNGGVASDTGAAFFRLAEDEWTRTYLELGPLYALLYFGFRISLVFYLLKKASDVARSRDDPLPLILFGFIGITLLNGQITNQGSINGYGWLFCGFCLAAAKIAKKNSI